MQILKVISKLSDDRLGLWLTKEIRLFPFNGRYLRDKK
jgi:hypothetical protein